MVSKLFLPAKVIRFNMASLFDISIGNSAENSLLIGRTVMNTTIASGSSGFFSFLIYYVIKRKKEDKYSIQKLCNGIQVGLIAVSSHPQGIESWAAFLIGLLGAGIYIFYAWAFKKMKFEI